MTLSPLEPALKEAARFMEDALLEFLPEPVGPQARLIEAMRYATLGGGKRVRAFLVLQSGRQFGVDRRALSRVAAAVECVHAYSLAHDDLPAMDDDDTRRGKPSTHKKFDEATAILAGDALLTHAFALIATPETHADPYVRSDLVARLALAAGWNGMVGGQMIDMDVEGVSDIGHITRLQRLKTGALIAFACDAGAIMGKASPQMHRALTNYAQDLGLAFQIVDDLLDIEQSSEQLGKTAGKDAAQHKITFPAVYGVERSHEMAREELAAAHHALEPFRDSALRLREIANAIVNRTH